MEESRRNSKKRREVDGWMVNKQGEVHGRTEVGGRIELIE